jgi:uncharacterized integral membrane protein
MAEEHPRQEEKSHRLGVILGAIAGVALLLFAVQNSEKIQTEFLWFNLEMPIFLLIFITAALTLIVAVVGAWILNRRSRKG